MSITRVEITRLRALLAQVTPGPWRVRENYHGDAWEIAAPSKTFPICSSILADTRDLEYIIAVHDALPQLLDALEALLPEEEPVATDT